MLCDPVQSRARSGDEEAEPEERRQREARRCPEVRLEEDGRLGDDARQDGPRLAGNEHLQDAAGQENLQEREYKERACHRGDGYPDLGFVDDVERPHPPAVPSLDDRFAECAWSKAAKRVLIGYQVTSADARSESQRTPARRRCRKAAERRLRFALTEPPQAREQDLHEMESVGPALRGGRRPLVLVREACVVPGIAVEDGPALRVTSAFTSGDEDVTRYLIQPLAPSHARLTSVRP